MNSEVWAIDNRRALILEIYRDEDLSLESLGTGSRLGNPNINDSKQITLKVAVAIETRGTSWEIIIDETRPRRAKPKSRVSLVYEHKRGEE